MGGLVLDIQERGDNGRNSCRVLINVTTVRLHLIKLKSGWNYICTFQTRIWRRQCQGTGAWLTNGFGLGPTLPAEDEDFYLCVIVFVFVFVIVFVSTLPARSSFGCQYKCAVSNIALN